METQSNQPTTQPDLEKQNRKDLSAYRRRLWGLIAISSGIDAVMFVGDLIALPFSMGSSFVVDEIIEFFLSNLLAKNKMRLKRRYKVVGSPHGIIHYDWNSLVLAGSLQYSG